MKLIVGLGNPGKKYQNSKHNIGFISLDSYAETKKVKFKKSVRFNSEYAKLDNAILLKPKTFMNLSGLAVRKVCDYYKIQPGDVMIIFDDLNLPFAKIRLRYNGSAGGHNGIKSIITNLYTDSFKRLRVGIGDNGNKEMKDYVLSDFNKSEMKMLIDLQIDISTIIEGFINEVEFERLMNDYN